MSAVQSILITLAADQARTLLATLDSLRSLDAEAAPVCPHPEDKIVTVGTMGNTTRICSLCRSELPPMKEGEAAS